MDINKVWLSGVVITKPILTKLSSQVPSCSFRLQVTEKYINKKMEEVLRPNIITIESLGRAAEKIAATVKQGSRYTVDGYIRVDLTHDGENIRIRSFAIYPDETSDNIVYKEGIKQALEILSKSKNLESAKEALEEIIK